MSRSFSIAALIAIGFVACAPPARAQQSPGMQGQGMHGMGGMMGYSMGQSGPGYMHFGWFGPGAMNACFMATGENGAFPSLDHRLEFIAKNLAITDAQVPQWTAYTTALKRSVETMQAAHQTMMANIMNMNFVERFNVQLNAMNTHLAQLQQVAPALSAVYTVLTPEQKAKADQMFRAMGCFM
ncbi:MAG: Spy/CpxP family protein refolding chaperone [Hyphomicrobium sp.]